MNTLKLLYPVLFSEQNPNIVYFVERYKGWMEKGGNSLDNLEDEDGQNERRKEREKKFIHKVAEFLVRIQRGTEKLFL